jgi:predicted lipoprotein with Yx(FWY)xxD motif
VIPGKRAAIFMSALAGAALALQACAPAGYDQDEAGQENVANEVAAAADPTPTPESSEGAEGTEGTEDGQEPTKDVAEEDLTTELTGKSIPRMGKAVVDQEGWILYRFDKDTAKPPATNCVEKCEQVWPPAYTEDGEPEVTGINDEIVGVVNRPDGTKQLTLDGWPLYRYIGDKKPGTWKGQGVGGTWFVVAPDGKRNLSCLPEGTPKAVEPPAADKDGEAGGDSGYSY